MPIVAPTLGDCGTASHLHCPRTIALRQPLLRSCVTVVMETKAPDGIEFCDDIVGKFMGRDMHETTVDVKGRNVVRISNFLVETVHWRSLDRNFPAWREQVRIMVLL